MNTMVGILTTIINTNLEIQKIPASAAYCNFCHQPNKSMFRAPQFPNQKRDLGEVDICVSCVRQLAQREFSSLDKDKQPWEDLIYKG